MKHRIIMIMAGILALASCNNVDAPSLSSDTERIMIKYRNAGLFADLEGYDWNKSNTRSDVRDSDETMVCLDELLDYSGSVSKKFKGVEIIQIPFIEPEGGLRVVLSSESDGDDAHQTYARKFYLKSSDEKVCPSRVVTMIPDSAYLANFTVESLSFLDKALFSGVILFSDPDGTFRDVYVYGDDGPVSDGQMDRPGTVPEDNDATGTFYLSCAGSSKPVTRLAENERRYVLHYSICIAETSGGGFPDPESLDNTLQDRTGPDPSEGKGSSGGGSSSSQSSNETEMNEDFFTCTVTLHTTAGGRVVGTGRYPLGRDVTVKATPYLLGYEFDRWTGDLNGRASTYAFSIVDDVDATAYFKSLSDTTAQRPCWSAYSDKSNPLIAMSLAASGSGGWNLTGATYGYTRYNVTENDDGTWTTTSKWHNGLDIYAEVGTPVYAMYDGSIGTTYVVTQPDMEASGQYPSSYKGDKNAAGNRIYVVSEIDDKKVSIGYCHLQSGNPVAINPRTGKTYQPGDEVFRGEIIAYTGKTGNAYNVANTHLHLTVLENGRNVNPETYINGKVQKHSGVTSAELVEIRCDEEPEDEEPSLDAGFLYR